MSAAPRLEVVPEQPPEFRRVGLDYEYRPADTKGLLFRAAFVKRSSDFEVTARVEVTAEREDMRPYLLGARFNLSSDTQRRNLAKSLGERAEQASVDWRQLIEAFCVKVERAEARGGLFKRVGAGERGVRRPDMVERLLPAGKIGLLYGPPGVGKGLLYVGMAVCMKYGLPFCGLKVQRGEPLVIDFEDDDETFLERVQAVSAGLGVEPPEIAWFKPRGLLKHNVHALAEIVAREHIDAVFLDSVGHAGGAGGEHGSYETAALELGEACKAISMAGQGGSLTWAWIDHVSAAGNAEKLAGKAIGAFRKIMDARVAWEIRKQQAAEEDHYTLALYHEKHNHTRKFEPIAIRLEFDNDAEDRPLAVRFRRADLWEYEDLASRDSSGLKMRLARALMEDVPARSVETLAEYLSADPVQVAARLRELRAEGKAVDFGGGRGRGKAALWTAPGRKINIDNPKDYLSVVDFRDGDEGPPVPLKSTGDVDFENRQAVDFGSPAPPPGTASRLPYRDDADDDGELDDAPF